MTLNMSKKEKTTAKKITDVIILVILLIIWSIIGLPIGINGWIGV